VWSGWQNAHEFIPKLPIQSMNSITLTILAICASMLISVLAYFLLSKREGSLINIMTPSFVTAIPAFYLLPIIYLEIFGAETSAYSYFWVYGALAVETICFVIAYLKTGDRVLRLPGLCSYSNFALLSLLCLLVGIAIYVPVLIEFRDFIFDPRQIYMQTRTGFGAQAFVSSTLAYLAVILSLFSKSSKTAKTITIVLATALLLLHGSKAQALSMAFILLLYRVYAQQRKIALVRALVLYAIVGAVGLGLFAATMSLGDDAAEMLEAISEYSDYTRNAMLVVDSQYPRQYGRLTIESNTLAIIPRQLMPGKPKNFGEFALAEEFYPEWFDKDTGSPAFGVGVPYADFGPLAILYIGLMAVLKGWLARIFVNRLKLTGHPADFFMIIFLADISIFPIGIGWLLPEALLLAVLLRLLSSIGARAVFRDTRNHATLDQFQSFSEAGSDLVG
jgi:oligosaccharide repeat unit polymerase